VFVIVCPCPARCVLLHFADALEQVLGQPVITHGSVEPFDLRVLLGLPGLRVLQRYALLTRPSQQGTAYVFGPIVDVTPVLSSAPD
jgi:hypothetical protein